MSHLQGKTGQDRYFSIRAIASNLEAMASNLEKAGLVFQPGQVVRAMMLDHPLDVRLNMDRQVCAETPWFLETVDSTFGSSPLPKGHRKGVLDPRYDMAARNKSVGAPLFLGWGVVFPVR